MARHKKDDDAPEEDEEDEQMPWSIIFGGIFMVSIPALWLSYKCVMIFVK